MRRTRAVLMAVVLCSGLTSAGCSTQVPSEQPAVDALIEFYDVQSGVWPTTGWWNSANALTAVIDYMISSGDRRYQWVVDNTYNKKRAAAGGNFTNYLIDDTGWWALAWIRAFDLTGNQRYLQTARIATDFMWRYQDDFCGGGLWWTTGRTYKNAIANELYIKAAAELDVRLGGGTAYLQHALEVWNWLDGSGMINDELLVNDGLNTATCANNGETTWTYNQGVILGGLVALATATGDETYLQRARELADASTTAEAIHVDGVLTEPCEATGCGIDAPSFKGIYVRNLGELDDALDDHPYQDYLADQAASVYEHNRTDDNRYGLHWAGPIDRVSGATQQSVVDLFVAAQPPDEPGATPAQVPAGSFDAESSRNGAPRSQEPAPVVPTVPVAVTSTTVSVTPTTG